MDWKFKLINLNWKFKLAIIFGISLSAIVLLKLPVSKAQTDYESSIKGNQISGSQGKITQYPNGVSKIEPTAFGISGAVRDMPTSDPDALVNRANFISAEERREMRIKAALKKNGLETGKDEEEEINELNAEIIKTIIPGAGAGYDAFRDPLVNNGSNLYGPQAMPTPSLTFNGATSADNASQGVGGLVPPDTNGDVGPNHYVSSVNLVTKIFNKDGTVAAGPFKTSQLFAALPANDPCRVQNDGDPIVLYDSLADRWHISQFALPSNGVNSQCVALSVTGDPTGAYYVWSYVYPGGAFNDYPKVGVWTDAYHMTFNQFNAAGTAYIGAGILSQDRAKALIGDPNASVVYFNLNTVDPSASGLLPGDIDGFVGPPTGLAEIIGEYRANEFGDPNDALRPYKWVPNFANPSASTLTVLPDVVLAPFDARSPSGRSEVEQMGGANLDAVSDRSMHRFAYRNFGTTAAPVNSYVGNFTVNVSGVNPTTAATYQTGIRWFEMRRMNDSFSVFDQGTHNLTPGNGASGLNNWMGSIAQDNQGDIALGFSQAGTTQRADIKIAGRTNNVANSGVLNEGEALMYAAGGSQTSTSNRWGDYSAMSVDPTDDCTFWYTQEYYATTSTVGWSTRVGKFRFPQCTDAPKATISGTITYCDGGRPIPNVSVDATGGFNRVTGAPGTYSITVSPGTYTVSASRSGGFNPGSTTITVGNGETATANICLTGFAIVSSQAPEIVAESCSISNGAPDPGEQITVSLPLQNTGAASTNNLTATLRATGGVQSPSGAQNYGALDPGSQPSTKNFSFTVDPSLACGATITLTFDITDGTTNYGTVTKTYTTGVLTELLNENFDSVTAPALPAGWSNVQLTGTVINWVTTTTNPSSAPNAAFANDPSTVNSSALVSPAVLISVQSGNAQLSFNNLYNTEANFDGMVLEYTTDGGTTWTDVITGGGSFVSGGYNSTISSDFSSPIAGRMAWSGSSGGYLSTVVNLPVALNGQTARFRWIMASDMSFAGTGVRIDDVLITGERKCSTGCASVEVGFEADVAPRPNGSGSVNGTNPVTSSDVSQLTRFQLGLDADYMSNEFQRADCAPSSTRGNGVVSSTDVAQATRYQLGLDAPQAAGGPTAPTSAGANVLDFAVGDKVSLAKLNKAVLLPRVVRVVNTNATAGSTVAVTLQVDAQGDESVYGFSLNYDPTKLTLQSITNGAATTGALVGTNPNNPGEIGFSVNYGNATIQAGNNQTFFTIQFRVAANAQAGSTSVFFDDTPTVREVSNTQAQPVATTFADGTVTIVGPTAASAAVGGRVLSQRSRGVANAQVVMTNSLGERRAARTNGFGYFRIAEVAAGETYTVTVKSKHYRFTAKVISVTQDVDDLFFTALP